jgi:hypothetical protein
MAAEITLLATIGEDAGGLGVDSVARLTLLVASRKVCIIQAMETEYSIRFRVAVNTTAAGWGPTHRCLRAKVQELVRFNPHQTDSSV